MNNETNNVEIFLASISIQEYNIANSKITKITYYSIIDGSCIFMYLTGGNVRSTNYVIKEEEISAYLVGLNQIKNEYTKKDLELLLDKIREN